MNGLCDESAEEITFDLWLVSSVSFDADDEKVDKKKKIEKDKIRRGYSDHIATEMIKKRKFASWLIFENLSFQIMEKVFRVSESLKV